MLNKTISLIATAAVLVLGSAAVADIHLDFGVSELNLDYTVGTGAMAITSSDDSSLETWLLDDATLLDYLQVDAAAVNPDTLYSLDLAFTQYGVDDWRATGTFSMRDVNNEVVAANFASTDVFIDDGTYHLKILGSLTPVGGNAGVLVPSAYAWTITDGIDSIDVSNATSYDTGVMINTQFTVWGGMTEDEFFTGDGGAVGSGRRTAGHDRSGHDRDPDAEVRITETQAAPCPLWTRREPDKTGGPRPVPTLAAGQRRCRGREVAFGPPEGRRPCCILTGLSSRGDVVRAARLEAAQTRCMRI